MTGASENYKHRGIIPRAITHLFREIDDQVNLAFTVRISYMEIYNEQIIDLLATLNEDNTFSNDMLTVVEDKNSKQY